MHADVAHPDVLMRLAEGEVWEFISNHWSFVNRRRIAYTKAAPATGLFETSDFENYEPGREVHQCRQTVPVRCTAKSPPVDS